MTEFNQEDPAAQQTTEKERWCEVLEQLYDMHAPTIMGVIRCMVPDEAMAEQVLQQTFVAAWSRIGVYNSAPDRFLTWGLAIARGYAREAALKYRQQTSEAAKKTESAMTIATPLQTRCSLPEEEKTALELVYLQGKSCLEAAATLGITEAKLKATIQKAIKHLKSDTSL